MQVTFPIATTHEGQFERPTSMVAEGTGLTMAIRQLFRPYVLAFLALALAVGGWGYGYKLSQYLHHSEVSKASATRMWVDHRDNSTLVPAHQSPVQQIPGSALVALSSPSLPRLSRDHALITPAPARVAFLFTALIPFRAPPALHPSLA